MKCSAQVWETYLIGSNKFLQMRTSFKYIKMKLTFWGKNVTFGLNSQPGMISTDLNQQLFNSV